MADDLLSRALESGSALAADPQALARRRKLPEHKLDPLVWVRERGVKIESKEYGLIQFDPFAIQRSIMHKVANWQSFIVEKSRQTGITTAIMVAYAHQLLYSQEVHGRPLHAHLIAHQKDACIEDILRMARIALLEAELEPAERNVLKGWDPEIKNPLLSYREGVAYIRAHSSEPASIRSRGMNAVLMEEVAAMGFPREAFRAAQGGLTTRHMLQLVSTYECEGDFFTECIDDADRMGLERIAVDWRNHPGRDEAWRQAQIDRLGEDDFGLEHELRRGNLGDKAVNMKLVGQFERAHEWIGGERSPTHRYSKGFDIAGSGEDSNAWAILDTTVRPAQLVRSEGKASMSTTDTVDKIVGIDLKWPGPLWIDGTMNPAIVGGVVAKLRALGQPTNHITAIRLRRAGLTVTENYDRQDGVKWRNVPRVDVEGRLANNLERGRIVVHTEQFPKLRIALGSWHRFENKRYRGRNIDYLDALLLAGLVLTKLTDPSQNGSRIVGIPSSPELQAITGQRW